MLYLDKIFRETEGIKDQHYCNLQDGERSTPLTVDRPTSTPLHSFPSPPPRGQWQLLATACLSIASKYEEAEEHCPPIVDLLNVTKLANSGLTPLQFRDGESLALHYLHWTLRAVTPLHFIGLHLARCNGVYENDEWQGKKMIDKIPKYINKYTDFFANLTLQEYEFQSFKPSLLASAILMASRVALQITPSWRPELEEITGYKEEEISVCFAAVWRYYEEQFPGHGGGRSKSPKGVEGGAGEGVSI